MTDTPAPVAQPLSAEEEAELRTWLTGGESGIGRGLAAYEALPRLLATLDAARSVPDASCICGASAPRRPWTEGAGDDPCRDGNGNFRPGHGYAVPDNAALRDWLVAAITASTLTNSGGYVQGFSAEEAADSILAAAPASIASHDATTPAEVDALLARMDEFAPNVRPSNPVYLRWLGLRIDLRAALASPEEPR